MLPPDKLSAAARKLHTSPGDIEEVLAICWQDLREYFLQEAIVAISEKRMEYVMKYSHRKEATSVEHGYCWAEQSVKNLMSQP